MLSSVVSLLETSGPVPALLRGREVWHVTRSPALADQLDALGQWLDHEVDDVVGERSHAAWLARYSQAHPAELPALARAAGDGRIEQVKAQFDALRETPADPRLTHPLFAWTLPVQEAHLNSFWGKAWTAWIKLLIHVGDPRSHALLDELEEALKPYVRGKKQEYSDGLMTTILLERIGRARERIPVPAETIDTGALEGALSALLTEPPTAQQVYPTTELQKARQAVLDSPDDLGAVAVWADLLQQAGDPLGHFVALQHAAESGPLDKKQRDALWRERDANVNRALGEVAPLVDASSAVFRGGVLYAARCIRAETFGPEILHHPALTGLRVVQTRTPHLRKLPAIERTGLRLVPHPAAGLKGPPGFLFQDHPPPGWTQLRAIAKSRKPLALQAICASLPMDLARAAADLVDLRGLPELRELHLVSDRKDHRERVVDRPTLPRPLAHSERVQTVPVLVLDHLATKDSADVLWDALRKDGAERLVLLRRDGFTVIDADADGLHATFTWPKTPDLATLKRHLGDPARYATIMLRTVRLPAALKQELTDWAPALVVAPRR